MRDRVPLTAARAHRVVTAGVLFLGACGGGSEALGGGAEVDACGGYEAYDELPEPDPTDARAVLDWADGVLRVIDRVDPDREVRDLEDERREVPPGVLDAFTSLKRSVEDLRDRVADAADTGTAAIRAAADSLALDEDFATADTTIRAFHTEICA